MSNPCPVPGCTGHQKTGKLMCLRHWRLVSPGTQNEVYRTWRAFQRASQKEDTFPALKAYRTARDRAVAEAGREDALHNGASECLTP